MALLCVALPMVSFCETVSRSGLRQGLLQGSWQANLSWQVGSLWQADPPWRMVENNF